MSFIDALFKGLYMGIIAFTIPPVVILYSSYFSIKRQCSLGVPIFLAQLCAYVVVLFAMLTGSSISLLESDGFHITISIISAILCFILCVVTVVDFIKYKEEVHYKTKKEDEDSFSEYEDISSGAYPDESIKQKDEKRHFGAKTLAFLFTLAFSLFSSSFVYWCDFSLYGTFFKISSYGASGGIFSQIIFAIVLLIVLLFVDILFSKLARFVGKYIKPLIMRPFIMVVSLAFLAFGITAIQNSLIYM